MSAAKCLVISSDRAGKNEERLVKANVYSQVREVPQVAPYGIDSAPIKDMVAIIMQTAIVGEDVINGYINNTKQAEEGSTRIYSEGTDIHVRANGIIEIGGNTKFFTTFTELQSALSTAITQINANFTTLAAALGTTLPPVTLDISAAKTQNVKTG